MISKHPICPELLRKVPKRFSWVDHRLVRHHYIEKCSCESLALYLFLVTVGDAQGLSFYSDGTLTDLLHINATQLQSARDNLIKIGLIAWEKPLYQVLALDVQQTVKPRPAMDGFISLGAILKQAEKEAS